MTKAIDQKPVEVRCVYLVRGLCSCPEAVRILGAANTMQVSCVLLSHDPRITTCALQWDRL